MIQWDINGIYPLVNIQKAMENGHRNSGFIHEKLWFSIVMLIYQRLCMRVYPMFKTIDSTVNVHVGAVLNLSSFLRYFIHLALALAPSCASQGFSAKWYPNTNLVYFAFHVAYLARVTFTIDRVLICRHLFPPFLNCCDNVLGSALCKLCSTQ